MALTFAKKAAGKPAPSTAQTSTAPASTKNEAKAPTSGGLSFLKRGAAAKSALAAEEAKAEMAAAEKGKLWRYWMGEDEERQITFLDGNLDSDSMLDINMFYEHNLKLNGKYHQFVCTSESAGHCPICDGNSDSKPYLAGVMTVIDHSEHKVKNGPNAGKIIANSRKLFVAKKQTIKILSKIAVKRGGLVGCTFDVSRGDEKTASVGSQFDFVGKLTLGELRSKYKLSEDDVKPADYTKEIVYRTPEELVELGVGKAPGGVGYEKGVKDKAQLAGEL